MLKRLVCASVISVALIASTSAAAFAAGGATNVASATSGVQVATPQAPTAATSTPNFIPPPITCTPSAQIVCTVVWLGLGVVCSPKHPCEIQGSAAAPAAAPTTAAPAAPGLRCAPSLQDLQCLIGTCPTHTCATTAGSAASPAIVCAPNVVGNLLCTILGLTICGLHRCGIDAASTTAAAPAITCAPNLVGTVLCTVLGVLCLSHHCYADAATTGTAARPASLPGDPCSRNWGQPIETICHL